MRSRPPVPILLLLFLCGAQGWAGCPDSLELLDSIQDPSGLNFRIYSDGRIFTRDSSGACAFHQQYFNPGFLDSNYRLTDTAIYQLTDSRALFRVRNFIDDNFESYSRLTDCIARSMADSLKNWFAFTLQGPLAPTVPDYVALRQCILNDSCTFRDNRIDPIEDPLAPGNHCMKFLAAAPSASMVTSKSSIENLALFFAENDTLLFEGRFLVLTGMPYSIADFENQWFEGSPGPRIVLSNNRLAIELKYGPKPFYRQRPGTEIDFPAGQWVNVRLRMAFRHDATAMIRLWQDDRLILDTLGRTLPTRNSLQTNLEVGISAAQERTELCMDDILLERLAAKTPSSSGKRVAATDNPARLTLSLMSGPGGTNPRLLYTLPRHSRNGRLVITDIRGRRLFRVAGRPLSPGINAITLNLAGFSAGLYLCTLVSDEGKAGIRIPRF